MDIEWALTWSQSLSVSAATTWAEMRHCHIVWMEYTDVVLLEYSQLLTYKALACHCIVTDRLKCNVKLRFVITCIVVGVVRVTRWCDGTTPYDTPIWQSVHEALSSWATLVNTRHVHGGHWENWHCTALMSLLDQLNEPSLVQHGHHTHGRLRTRQTTMLQWNVLCNL